jgi:hypothetical protein
MMEHVLEFKMAGEKSLVHFNLGGGGQATSLKDRPAERQRVGTLHALIEC